MSKQQSEICDTYEAVTIFTREDGRKKIQFGRHEGYTYFTEDDKLATEEAEVFELDEPVTPAMLLQMDLSDLPDEVTAHLNGDDDD